MYENKKEPLAPVHVYHARVAGQVLRMALVLGACLMIGVLGYHFLANAAWIDAIHNASMILSGMGPVIDIKTTSGKIFSSCYALFAGIAFVTSMGLVLTPIAHRFFHKLHVEDADDVPTGRNT